MTKNSLIRIRGPFLKVLHFNSSTKLQNFFLKFVLLTDVTVSDAHVNHTEILKNLILYTYVAYNMNEMTSEQRMVVSGVLVGVLKMNNKILLKWS